MKMDEALQLVPYVKSWNPLLVPATFEPSQPDAGSSPRQLFLSSLTQRLFEAYLEFTHANHAATYVDLVDDEAFQNALDSLNLLFACQSSEVIETFANYLSGRNIDGVWKRKRQDFESSSAVSLVGPYEGLTEGEARDHCVHLETIILAKEQEAPTASAVGQILNSGRELWMRWKNKLLHSLSGSLRSRSSVGFQIALGSAAQVSFC
jgi:hypothetical protein